MFDQAVDEVAAGGGLIDKWIQRGGGGAVFGLNANAVGMRPHLAEIRRMLATGKAGGHMDLTDTGLSAVLICNLAGREDRHGCRYVCRSKRARFACEAHSAGDRAAWMLSFAKPTPRFLGSPTQS